ncbi:MAG TPA: LysR family transcriptional regulator [Xanthobacteraceae bacterium]|jgi:DNA-binding transcriptional LysR family regulator|nr:LysR family transcriptional regulator [Xanthobacteraceae bacterium]
MPLHKNNIPIALYRSFVAIADHGSFTKAAEELHQTQSAISVQMKRLQGLVGDDLFVKQGAGVGLSELGLAVAGYARRILILNDQVMALAGRASSTETLYVGIQSLFAGQMLSDVLAKCTIGEKRCQIICNSAPYLAEKLQAGYVDLALMIPPSDLRRNVVMEWMERMVWVRAPHLPQLTENDSIPLVHRESGLIDRQVMKLMDDRSIGYEVVFGAMDMATLVAATEAGMGFLIVAERVLQGLSDVLVVADDPILPKLPPMRAGVFHKEGFDLARNRAIVDAFLSVVRPPQAKLHQVIKPAAETNASLSWPRRAGTKFSKTS